MDEYSRLAARGSGPPVDMVMRSDSDLPVMEPAAAMVQRFHGGL